ncbi:hypothetical protein Xmau_00396 [Xenorhabdus mauleonii]|uniref:Uncharacterized protein n=1 Tax=Xenorhabdus mauleonii TaxID=351675 RepID=A0A1I3UDU5_9GAMM|nr:hypothetical protein [Xenorhabdus mauleonii]PHM46003.1 hypothetical protein Xmau_00396 [Xenorhabdus mauleonii]SFJ80893.1 hypothetical protein SAMN05421680_116111 [Xenorhabdus mauleonii]
MTKQERYELTTALKQIKEASDYLHSGRVNDGRITVDIVEAILEAMLNRKK